LLTEIDNCSYNTKHQAAAKKLGEHGKPLLKPEKNRAKICSAKNAAYAA